MKKVTEGELAQAIANFVEGCDVGILIDLAKVCFPDAEIEVDWSGREPEISVADDFDM